MPKKQTGGAAALYTENHPRDALLFAKALLSNQLARFAPSTYMRLTQETGRGGAEQSAVETAAYFARCVEDYRGQLGLDEAQFGPFLKDKSVLEYGPGDIFGVALLMYARGAARVHCVDRFPLHRASVKNLDVYREIVQALDEPARSRANSAFNEFGKPESGFNSDAICYVVSRFGVSGAKRAYDLIISRAVLEHVNDLGRTFQDVANALKPNGTAVHQVDLKSHGLDRCTRRSTF